MACYLGEDALALIANPADTQVRVWRQRHSDHGFPFGQGVRTASRTLIIMLIFQICYSMKSALGRGAPRVTAVLVR